MKHDYRDLSPEKQEEVFSNYMFDRWSYSKVNSFSRNEKAFEATYIYSEPFKKSASSVAGSVYHKALEMFFDAKMNDNLLDITDLQLISTSYIEEVEANEWKLQKTTPTIEKCIEKSLKTSNSLLLNFFSDISVYLSELKSVLSVEGVFQEFLNINGVDIPLPCKGVIDLVVELNDDRKVIIDHKSKASFSDEKEAKFSIGKQAVIYYKLYEAVTGVKVDEVWFVENKYSKNRDGSPQMVAFKIKMDKDTIALYEAMLYEPLKRMLEAVSDPDYVYLMNENDNFVDKAEMYEFWGRTMIAEVDDFNIPENKKEAISKRLKKIRNASLAAVNPTVIKKFRENAASFITYDLTNKNMTNSEKIEHILRTFGIVTQVEHVFKGYSSNTYLLSVTAGTKITSVNKYRLDIANALNVANIRIMKDLFVFENKSYLAIESSKKKDGILLFDPKYIDGMKIPIGLDNFNNPVIWDLNNHSTPHVLICGATGSGKSVSIISTIEYSLLSGVDDIYVFDPKYEFVNYGSRKEIKVFNDILEIEEQMISLVELMQERAKTGVDKKVLIVFDEFADAVANARKGKELDIIEEVQVGTYAPKKLKGMFGEQLSEAAPKMAMKKTGEINSLEQNLKILLQKGRSLGFRIVSATQRASTKVITGDAKVNFPVQICFRVPKETDSRVVLDEAGAESLSGEGDGLIKSPEYLNTIRFQGFYKQ